MKRLALLAIATLIAPAVWAQNKSAPPPKPPADSPKGPATKQGDQKPSEEEIDKRRDRMKQRDGEIDKMMKQKGKK